ncbi:hypothetical protein KUTeg_008803 [Tegillarca granosa]|uniref:Short-chain collagen C4-like n=1 Tax=Tegillarca granosa TaxID=220873 RepID=A0ABQ9FA75_TEGGR|nr:hypothetical protein KUTeg_008803 [Tegillarca granosa]
MNWRNTVGETPSAEYICLPPYPEFGVQQNDLPKTKMYLVQCAEVVMDGNTNQNGKLFYSVKAECEGAMYIRWGRKECPNATELVYSGFAGGSHYTHGGGAAEYVCLPRDPEFGVQQNVGAYGYIYGAEYQTNYFGPAEDQDVPCAVCRSLTGTSVIMIPAKSTCYPNWKREYHGRLASGYFGHTSASQYVCVDETPEAVIGGNSNSDGKLFYPVKAECGSLECPPYQNDKEVLCVVCTQGAMYIRWGRTECPNATELVYSGYAGGNHYTQSGGAAEYVCLPPDPEFGVQQKGDAYGYVYGAEYQTNNFGPAQDQDVPCAVCRSLTGMSVVMIPAKSSLLPKMETGIPRASSFRL